jgi:ribonuclease HII
MNILPDFQFEKDFLQKYPHIKTLVGIDEAGRGPLAGPVVAVAASYRGDGVAYAIPEKFYKEFSFLRDSKTLSEKKRESLMSLIAEYFVVGVGIIYPETIDRVNILQATFLAMKEAVGDWQRTVQSEAQSTTLLIDGNQTIPHFSWCQERVIGGDKRVKSIATASIVAKVTRDRMMTAYDVEYPEYGFAKHKGYGTKVHMEALQKYGPTPIHRLSFAPVRQALFAFRELGVLP